MKTKTHIFNGKLYLEGLKRLRIIGLAFAILCLAICVIVPVARWADEARYDFYDTAVIDPITGEFVEGERGEHPVEYVEDARLAIPALVASYLSPLFVFLMFSYLNKRNESDFYHAIPYTRTCVYVSFCASVLTWVFGILIVSSLSAGLLWAVCPYTTFSFVGLLKQMLYMCLNAGMLMGITAVAVSLMGTPGTAAVAACVLLASWRVVMGLAGVYLSDVNDMLRFEDILGGYLYPNMLFPVSLITQSDAIERGGVLVYATLIMLAAFVLGGFLYARRRSETAGRAVPAKWLQIAIRCLLALPFGLLITYLFMTGNADGSTLIVLLAVMLLAFYLYELLTSKSVRSMLRATPWLFAVLGACVIFGSACAIADYTVKHERIDEHRIVAVGVDASSVNYGYGIGRYEMMQLKHYMSDNDEAANIVARALAETQEAVRTDNYYFQNTGAGHMDYKAEYVNTRIKLKGGMTVTRRIRFHSDDYKQLLEILREEKETDPIPDAKEVGGMALHMMSGHYESLYIEQAQYAEVLRTMRAEWLLLNEKQQLKFLNGDISGGTDAYALKINVVRQKQFCYLEYAVMRDAMPRTYALLDKTVSNELSTKAEIEKVLDAIEESENCVMHITADIPNYEKPLSYGYFSSDSFCEVIEFLRKHTVEDPRQQEGAGYTYLSIQANNVKLLVDTDGAIHHYRYRDYDDIFCRMLLNVEEQHELRALLARAEIIETGEIVFDSKDAE